MVALFVVVFLMTILIKDVAPSVISVLFTEINTSFTYIFLIISKSFAYILVIIVLTPYVIFKLKGINTELNYKKNKALKNSVSKLFQKTKYYFSFTWLFAALLTIVAASRLEENSCPKAITIFFIFYIVGTLSVLFIEMFIFSINYDEGPELLFENTQKELEKRELVKDGDMPIYEEVFRNPDSGHSCGSVFGKTSTVADENTPKKDPDFFIRP